MIIDTLRIVHVLRGLSDNELFQLASVCRKWPIPADYMVFREGDAGSDLYIVQHGSVRISLSLREPDGSISQGTVNALYPGQSFGELVLLDGSTRSATVVSQEPSVLLCVDRDDFLTLCAECPSIGYRVMRNMACDLATQIRLTNQVLRGAMQLKHDPSHSSHQ